MFCFEKPCLLIWFMYGEHEKKGKEGKKRKG
jgi:hypothetical protein